MLAEDLADLRHGAEGPAASRRPSQTPPALPGLSPTYPPLASLPPAAIYRHYSLGSRFLLHSPRWCLLNPALRSVARYKISVASHSCSTGATSASSPSRSSFHKAASSSRRWRSWASCRAARCPKVPPPTYSLTTRPPTFLLRV